MGRTVGKTVRENEYLNMPEFEACPYTLRTPIDLYDILSELLTRFG
jgi:hypothetical protein